MIINIYKNKIAEQAYTPKKQKMKYKDIIRSISKEIGIGLRTISTTLSEYNKKGTVTSPNKNKIRPTILEKVDEFSKNAIRQKIHGFWLRKEIPTFNKILVVINEDSSLPTFSKTSFRRILKDLNFEYNKSRNHALIESGDIVLWRRKYLDSIKHYRQQNRPIYYLDETWVNAGEAFNKTWVDQPVKAHKQAFLKRQMTEQQNSSFNEKTLIVIHIGSSEGFVSGGLLCLESKRNSFDCHDEINGDIFYEWFMSILPLLKDNAVIVMDNAPCHSMKRDLCPDMSWKKQNIIDWLEVKEEKIDRPLVKQQLLEKVEHLKPVFDRYVIDEIARDNNKIVLRIPPYHSELNPIELAWSAVKNYISMNNTTYKLTDAQSLLREGIEQVTPNMWSNFVNHVMKEEDKCWEIDFLSDELLDNEPAPKTQHVLTITEEITKFEYDDDDDDDDDK